MCFLLTVNIAVPNTQGADPQTWQVVIRADGVLYNVTKNIFNATNR